eukprot:TRINITY_DN2875_c0_g1_i1.p1 TRINITY_DN2875_c0_g1~~TRINITY_DN2875_c0_g1_i1.p1  ORF type:complete len:204 (-),score=38.88 TRINITY_DN2875_c0_g1_i1:225-836(-)
MGFLTFSDEKRILGQLRLQALLKLSWKAEYFGVGMMEELAAMFPEHRDILLACANMEWLNASFCKRFGDDVGMNVDADHAEMLMRLGAATARTLRSFNAAAKLMIIETPEALFLYERLRTLAGGTELKALADDLIEHEKAMRDWFKSENDGMSDGGRKVFEYLERHGIRRAEAILPRPKSLSRESCSKRSSSCSCWPMVSCFP